MLPALSAVAAWVTAWVTAGAGIPCPVPADTSRPPRPSALNRSSCDGAPWPRAVHFGEGEREAFGRDGFIVLRHFLTPAVVATLAKELQDVCRAWPQHPDPRFDCFVSGAWMRSDVSRDFLYFGPVGKTIQNLLNVRGVRIQEDGYLVHTQYRNGTAWHTDANYHGGIYGDFHRRTKGATIWIALTDIDAKGDGGSILISRAGHSTNCATYMGGFYRQRFPLPLKPDNDACLHEISERRLALSFQAGDAIVWQPLMPHATQPLMHPQVVPQSGGLRLSWYARLVESDAVFCHQEYLTKAAHAHAYCQHSLRPRQKARHVCYQQVHPLLPQEVSARMRRNWSAPVLAMTPCIRRSLQREAWWHGGWERRACTD